MEYVLWQLLWNVVAHTDAVAEGVLDEAGPTLHLGGATEGPLGVLAL